MDRREILKASGGAGVLALATAAGLLKPEDAGAQQQRSKLAFETQGVADTLKALGAAGSTESQSIDFGATSDIAENNSAVPVVVESKLPNTQSIAILIEKNPRALSAVFEIPEGTDPFITTRVKMAETSNVYALVRAGGKYYHAKKEIKVTAGGCGG